MICNNPVFNLQVQFLEIYKICLRLIVLFFWQNNSYEDNVRMKNIWNYILGEKILQATGFLDPKSDKLIQWNSWYSARVVDIFRNKWTHSKSPVSVAISRVSPLSWEELNIKKDLDRILNFPIFNTPQQRLLKQKQNRDEMRKSLTYWLLQRIQAGALVDNNMKLSGQSQKSAESFIRYFGNALRATLDWQFPDSQISGFILQIYRSIIISWKDPTKSINWKQSLQEITIDGLDKYHTREFIQRMSSIFDIFIENYVKILWAQEI